MINERVSDLADQVKFDAAIFPLIYPSVIREILGRALDEQADPDDEGDRWPVLWLRFARRLNPEQEVPSPASDDDLRQEWIAEVVQAFCPEHALRETFVRRTGGEENWEASV